MKKCDTLTTEEIHTRGCKTIDDEIENGDIVMERYPGEIENWNEQKTREWEAAQGTLLTSLILKV